VAREVRRGLLKIGGVAAAGDVRRPGWLAGGSCRNFQKNSCLL